MSDSSKNSNKGLSIFAILQVVFLCLYIGDVIKWKWYWVASPTIAYVVCWILIFLFVMFLSLIAGYIENERNKRSLERWRKQMQKDSKPKF